MLVSEAKPEECGHVEISFFVRFVAVEGIKHLRWMQFILSTIGCFTTWNIVILLRFLSFFIASKSKLVALGGCSQFPCQFLTWYLCSKENYRSLKMYGTCVLYYDPMGFVYVKSASRRNDIKQCFSSGWLSQLDEISRCTKCMDDLPTLKEATTRPIFFGGYFIHPRWLAGFFPSTVSLYYPPFGLSKPC